MSRGAGLADRSIATLLTFAVAVLFLFFYGPVPQPSYAQVYSFITQTGGFLLPPPGEGTRLSDPRTVRVNGQKFQYRVGRTPRSLEQTLNDYARQFIPRIVRADGTKVGAAFRISGAQMGIVGGWTFDQDLQLKDLTFRLGELERTGKLSSLGQFHVVVAYGGKETTFLHFTPGADFRLDQLVPATAADAASSDLPGIQAPPGGQRYLTIEQEDCSGACRTVFYRVPNPAQAALAALGARLAAFGWSRNPVFNESGGALHYVRNTGVPEECFMAAIPTGSETLIAVVYRANSR